MNLLRWGMAGLRWLLVPAMAFGVSSAMAHGNASGVLSVSAEVRPTAVLKLRAVSSGIAIKGLDLSRGYVEIPAEALLNMTAGKIRPLLFLDSVPLSSERGTYRFDLSGKAASGAAPVILGIEL